MKSFKNFLQILIPLAVLILLMLLFASCSYGVSCPTYSGAKKLSVKVGTYNPPRPHGYRLGKMVIN
jgi:hypothetical protein